MPLTLWDRLRAWLRRDDGDSAVALVIIVPMLMLATFGLTHDWAGKVRASEEAVTIAQQAARAGANAGAQAKVSSGKAVTLDRAAAQRAAQAYLARSGAQGSVSVNAREVSVSTTVDYHPQFLPVGTLHGRGEGTAELRRNDG